MRLKYLCPIFLVRRFSWSSVIINRETNDMTLPEFETSDVQQDQWDKVFPSTDQSAELDFSGTSNDVITASLPQPNGQTDGSSVNDGSADNGELNVSDGSSTSEKAAIRNDGIYSNAGPLKTIQVWNEIEGV